MKKIIIIFVLMLVIVTGCGKKNNQENIQEKYSSLPEVSVTCTRFLDFTEFKQRSTYTIVSKGDIVIREVGVERFASDDPASISYTIDYFTTEFNKESDNLGGLTYQLRSTDNTVILESTLDHAKMNMQKYAEEYKLSDDDVLDGFVRTNVVIDIYKKTGFTCE